MMGPLKIARLFRRRQPAAGRRSLLLVIALTGSLAAAYVVVGVSGWVAATTIAEAASLPETASLSGTVDSTAPFKAAQVFIRNVDRRILYMVYTNAGQFRSVALFPGNYEISVTAKGLQSDVQKLVVKTELNCDSASLSLAKFSASPMALCRCNCLAAFCRTCKVSRNISSSLSKLRAGS